VAAILVVLAIALIVVLIPAGRDLPSMDPQDRDALDDPVLRLSAENGDPTAQYRLGKALFQDPLRTAKTSAQAVGWLKAAAEGGDVDAMIYYGRLLYTGVGVLQNFTLASQWIRTAALRGSSEGMLEMGRLYRDGIGVQKDSVKAYVWFNRAAAARNLDAVGEREAIGRALTSDQLSEAQHQSSQPEREGDDGRGSRPGEGGRKTEDSQ
jgi:TPR repeat protein